MEWKYSRDNLDKGWKAFIFISATVLTLVTFMSQTKYLTDTTRGRRACLGSQSQSVMSQEGRHSSHGSMTAKASVAVVPWCQPETETRNQNWTEPIRTSPAHTPTSSSLVLSPVLKGLQSQNSATIWGWSVQIHKLVGDIPSSNHNNHLQFWLKIKVSRKPSNEAVISTLFPKSGHRK